MKNLKKKVTSAAAISMSVLLGCFQASAAQVTSSSSGSSFSSITGGENAVLVNSGSVTLTSPTVTKTGDESGDEADFQGTNAAVLVSNAATLTVDGGTITTNGSHANAAFSYGTGSTLNISNTTIQTTGNNSGGIMTTGGGTMNASNLNISTTGNSSAAIRSDRGGGDVNVSGGTYQTSGVGSPAIYSTADIDVSDASLLSNVSEAIVIEGGNSVSLTNTNVIGNNTQKNGQSTTYQNVMIYQSMSGDASSGKASFEMNGGSMTAGNGYMFYVTNNSADITLTNAALSGASDLLYIAAGPWGNSGSNGGNVNLNASSQALSGTITIDDISTLNLVLSNGSIYEGQINNAGQAGSVYVEVPDGTSWKLTGNSYVTSLTCGTGSIDLNGYTLYVNGVAYTAGTASQGTAVASTVSSTSTGMGGQMSGGQMSGGSSAGGTGRKSDAEAMAEGNAAPALPSGVTA